MQMTTTGFCEDCGKPLQVPENASIFRLRLRVCGACGDERRERTLQDAVDVRMAAWDRRRDDWLAGSGLPHGGTDRTLDTFTAVTAAEHGALAIARDWVESFDPQHPERSCWLVFVGASNGTGKTHLVQAMLRAIIDRCLPDRAMVERWERAAADAPVEEYQRLLGERRDGRRAPVGWWVAGELLMRLASAPRLKTFDAAVETETELFDRVTTVPVLGLDDLGRAKSFRQEEEQVNLWFLVLNARYNRRLPVLATSNKTERDLKPVLGREVVDRLREMATFVPLEGESHRG